MSRLFIALDTDDKQKEEFLDIISKAKKQIPFHIRVSNPHMTMFFLGEVEKKVEEEISQFLGQFSDYEQVILKAIKVTHWPIGANPRIFAILFEQNKKLSDMYFTMRSFLQNVVMGLDMRPFLPHITLARFEPRHLFKLDIPLSEEFAFKSITLYQSVLKKTGAEHIPLKKINLKSN